MRALSDMALSFGKARRIHPGVLQAAAPAYAISEQPQDRIDYKSSQLTLSIRENKYYFVRHFNRTQQGLFAQRGIVE